MILRSLFSFLVFVSALPAISQTISLTPEGLLIENREFAKTFKFSKSAPAPVSISSIVAKPAGGQLLESRQPAYFEIGINKKVLSAADPVWVYKTHSTRSMPNEGLELRLELEAVKGPAKGLKAVVIHQHFKTGTLIREQLLLEAPAGKSYALHKINGKLHLKFPQYAIKAAPENTEIRIATWGKEKLDFDKKATYDDRKFDGGAYFNLSQCHMFHPDVSSGAIDPAKETLYKGPMNIIGGEGLYWFSAYEHASQDNLEGFKAETMQLKGGSAISVDAQQSAVGTEETYLSDKDLWFLALSVSPRSGGGLVLSTQGLRGAYLHGELITAAKPYATVWTAAAFYQTGGAAAADTLIHDYLMNKICEKPASRVPEFYYNTWGMQRELDSKGFDLRGVFTEERILREMESASELGVQIFVLDDGWEQAHGIWTPHIGRLPNGLAPLREAAEKRGMKLGVWFSPMGIDSTTERYRLHRDKVITGAGGVPIKAQWGHPAFDFVSDFYDLFVDDCKKLIDQGVLFMKWDAINSYYSTLPNLHHGSNLYTARERLDRYDYLLPIYVTRAMKELIDYQPELVIEIDLTETDRNMVGLAPLSAGKFFWMNNGASGYNDYSSYRAKSMRMVASEYAGILPLELLTFANYPHNPWPFYMQRYNVNTSLLAGHGFWGNLDLMTSAQRKRAGALVKKSLRVLPYIAQTLPLIKGEIGSAPEIYTVVNKEQGAGQILAFSSLPIRYTHRASVEAGQVLAVLNHAYEMSDTALTLNFEFSMSDDTREAFILPRSNCKWSIVQSDVWIDDVQGNLQSIKYTPGAADGTQTLALYGKEYAPERIKVEGGKLLNSQKTGYGWLLKVKAEAREVEVKVL